MLKIDNNLLEEVGLGALPPNEKRELLNHIYETLEMRVGMRLADQMTDEQLNEFEVYFNNKDDAGAFRWLETNFPNYKEIVNEEFEKLKAEVKQAAPQILQASQQASVAPQQPAAYSSPSQGGDQTQVQPGPAMASAQPSPAPVNDGYGQPMSGGYPQPQQQPMPQQQPYANPVQYQQPPQPLQPQQQPAYPSQSPQTQTPPAQPMSPPQLPANDNQQPPSPTGF
jgi:hypothetical protein